MANVQPPSLISRWSISRDAELVATTRTSKPTIALVEPDVQKGGLTLEQIRTSLIEAEERLRKRAQGANQRATADQIYSVLFKNEPIEWNRLGTLRCCAVRLRSLALMLPHNIWSNVVLPLSERARSMQLLSQLSTGHRVWQARSKL